MTVSDFIVITTKKDIFGYAELKPRVFCNDGYHVSIQCGKFSYSEPKEDTFNYSMVELGFPSSEDCLINEFAELDGDYTETIYPYVPIELVHELLEKHGGIDKERTFKRKKYGI